MRGCPDRDEAWYAPFPEEAGRLDAEVGAGGAEAAAATLNGLKKERRATMTP